MNKSKRFRVLSRCNFGCHYCGRRAGDVVLEIDHVIPKSRGGTDDESNLVAACEDCNRGKGADVEMRLERFDLPNGKVLFEYPDHTRPSAAEMRELLA